MGISNSMYTAVTGLETFGSALSVVSDNIANADTTGFKSSSTLFGDLVSGYMSTQGTQQVSQGAGTTLLGVATDFTTGSSTHTGTWSNVMLEGSGFFSVNTGTGGSGTTYYTRDGSFKVDSSGYLVNNEGYRVQGVAGDLQVQTYTTTNGVTSPTYVSWEVDKSGAVWGTPSSGSTKVQLGTLSLTTFANQQGLEREGDNLYTSSANAGTATTNTATAKNAEAGSVISGSLEGSNVDLATEMVNMIIYQSDYTANSKAITTANNMLDTVVNLIR